MDNWREMGAGRQLDWLIAQKQGWHVIQQNDKYIRYRVVDPSGYMPAPAIPCDSEEAARALAWIATDRGIPHYSTSVDAALSLIPDALPMQIHKRSRPSGVAWAVKLFAGAGQANPITGWLGPKIPVEKTTLALEICRAWLTWQEGHER